MHIHVYYCIKINWKKGTIHVLGFLTQSSSFSYVNRTANQYNLVQHEQMSHFLCVNICHKKYLKYFECSLKQLCNSNYNMTSKLFTRKCTL